MKIHSKSFKPIITLSCIKPKINEIPFNDFTSSYHINTSRENKSHRECINLTDAINKILLRDKIKSNYLSIKTSRNLAELREMKFKFSRLTIAEM